MLLNRQNLAERLGVSTSTIYTYSGRPEIYKYLDHRKMCDEKNIPLIKKALKNVMTITVIKKIRKGKKCKK
jgi:hypothetical protein